MKITFKRILLLCIFVMMFMSLTACSDEKSNRLNVDPSTQYTIEFVEMTGYNYKKEISYNNAFRVTSIGEYPIRVTVSYKKIAVEPCFFTGESESTQTIEVGVGESKLITYGNPYIFLTDEFTVDNVTLLPKPAKVIDLSVLGIIIAVLAVVLTAIVLVTTDAFLCRANVGGGLALYILTMLLIMGVIELFSVDSVTFIIFGIKLF